MSADSNQNQAKRIKTGGRKRSNVDATKVDELASICMKSKDIATICGISETTLQRKFGSLLAKRRAEARERILRKQWDIAESTNKGAGTLSIWLGKNYAEQSDRTDVTSGGEALKVIVERIG